MPQSKEVHRKGFPERWGFTAEGLQIECFGYHRASGEPFIPEGKPRKPDRRGDAIQRQGITEESGKGGGSEA